MYENLTYPVFVVKKFEQITYSQVDEYLDGEVFEYNPIDQVHIALNEHGYFKQIPNSECKFRAQRELSIGGNSFNTGDTISYEQLPELRISDLVLAGFIKKIYLGDAQKNKVKIKKSTAPKTKKRASKPKAKKAKTSIKKEVKAKEPKKATKPKKKNN